MTHEEIMERLTEVFRDIFDDDSICVNENTVPEDIEEWDELSHIDIITAVEDEFSMRFRTREVSGVKNAGEISEIIMERAGTRSEI
ncbi:MAG: acyl carrier protein [Oscillospiraceae bacterium]|nr:acyl carrier protein [Oscillospiraceae bacterium]